jgi:hypothetical protein
MKPMTELSLVYATRTEIALNPIKRTPRIIKSSGAPTALKLIRKVDVLPLAALATRAEEKTITRPPATKEDQSWERIM